ncbi:cilia- and flagella-associated protein 61-like [Daktulosphaira vitifoliae]|uniref:cilia- and flagella-associated protein 61-like n=1 Tax=Daktulosphaira vitifoliae TaxID=58002 RepID=UPI0021A9E1D5|nr:cilia- and flagella-associated protein 61-like [Daktulosphaira vitifoliae]
MNGIKPNGDTEAIEYSIGSWRIVLLSDLPELEEMVNNVSRKVFGPFDITLMIFKNVTQNNTLFIHLLLFQNFEYMAYFSLLLQTVYSQLPEISYIFLVKPPNTELCAELCLPFHTLRGKISNLESENPEILYHSKDFIIKKTHLRLAEESDNDDLRQNLGKKLHFMDKYYGEYCLAELFGYPGNNRVNLVPIVRKIMSKLTY